MPWETVLASVEEAKKLLHPMNYDFLDLLESRYNYLPKYANPVLLALDTIHR